MSRNEELQVNRCRGVLSKVRGRWISGMRLEICGENRTGTALWRVAKAEKAAAKEQVF